MNDTVTVPSCIRVEYRLTRDEIIEATRLHLLSRSTLAPLFGTTRRRAPNAARAAEALLCMFAGAVLFAAGAAYLAVAVSTILLLLELLPIAMVLLIVISLRKGAAANLRKLEGHPMFQQDGTVVVDERGVRSTRATCRYDLEWSGALRLRETANLIMVVDCEPRAVIIPKRVLSAEQLRELRRLARERIPK